ncbi:UDP-glycosyltransferase 85A7 isoform X2 [Selaginella moellendorffii]|uniref:UDP-glycosyltransferase 85A7 isoform X2 n=1 Tax=Selaginella moellendorffii TaxID=88036 RepID=UPI000D1CF155|nr:UDP-glycosyltransferase 85A7 isoform X2 [Selaginella moellendorffii]|eukprot:XP_024540910.1 UDP-glycosyltransferase 85A7 isoform X2 [Selaginella moellendorffii]
MIQVPAPNINQKENSSSHRLLAMAKHIVALPFPGEGHVSPMMHLSIFLAQQGFSITLAAMTIGPFDCYSFIKNKGTWPPPGTTNISVKELTSTVPFPAEAISENRADMTQILRYAQTYLALMEELVRAIPDEVCCIISDYLFDWCPKLAAKLGVLGVVLIPASATVTWCELSIARLAAAGMVPSQPDPEIRRSEIPWHFCNDKAYQDHIAKFNSQALKAADLAIVNTCMELEGQIVSAISQQMDDKFLPVGPLFLLNDEPHTVGFGVCDTDCLKWLDEQPPSSVLYISFGSFAVMTGDQMEEIVRGLEASSKKFLWVIRPEQPEISKVRFPSTDQGMVVSWSPQTKVLSHPSVGAFLSHCGWNSTVEAVASGKPVLCWPLLFEQNTNSISLVRKWKVGIRFAKGRDGMVSRDEVERIIRLAMDGEQGRQIRERAEELGEKIRSKNVPGSGLERFVTALSV